MTRLDVEAIIFGQVLVDPLEDEVKLTAALLQARVATHRIEDFLTLACLLGLEPVCDILLKHRVLLKACVLAA